jgi:hypothetical protein
MFSHMQELLSQQDIKTVRPLSVRMIFEDNHNWDAFSLANKDILRDVEIKEVNKMMFCKDEKRGFSVISRTATTSFCISAQIMMPLSSLL